MRLSSSRSRTSVRALWFALAMLVLGIQTLMPAHEATHAFGAPDTACQFCVLGGHLSGMPGVTPPAPFADVSMEVPAPALTVFFLRPQPRTRFSRGPPPSLDA